MQGALKLLGSDARAASGTGDVFYAVDHHEALIAELDVTAAATETGDTLDVYIQTTVDGTNWVDIVHFTQVLGDGGAKRYYTKVVRDLAMTEFETTASFSAASVRGILGNRYRARWAITDASTANASFTFS